MKEETDATNKEETSTWILCMIKKMDSEFLLYSYVGYVDVSCGRGVCVVSEENSMRLGVLR
jgi:hypothetical protein